MSLGSFLYVSKRLASLADGGVFISKEIRDRSASEIKAEKHFEHSMEFYTVTEIRDREKSQKFINDFIRKQESERKD